jgi:flagellar hook assembly protein FlgD
MIRTLLEGTAGVGRHQVAWDGTDADGRNVSSGVYLYRLEAGGEHLSGRMTLLR